MSSNNFIMKTIIYFLSVLAVLLCTSSVLLSQEREIGVIRNGKPMLVNNDVATAYFKAAYGPKISVTDLNIQWSKEHNSYFLVGKTNTRGVTGLQLSESGNGLTGTAGPGIEISCAPTGDCASCNLSDAVCQCTFPPDASGLCMIVSKYMIVTW